MDVLNVDSVEMTPLTDDMDVIEIDDKKNVSESNLLRRVEKFLVKKLPIMLTTQRILIMKSLMILTIAISALLIGCATYTRLLKFEAKFSNYTETVNNVTYIMTLLEERNFMTFYLTNCLSFVSNYTQIVYPNTYKDVALLLNDVTHLVWRGSTQILNNTLISIADTGTYMLSWNMNINYVPHNSSVMISISLKDYDMDIYLLHEIGTHNVEYVNNSEKSISMSGSTIMKLNRGMNIYFSVTTNENIYIKQKIITLLYLD
jgi:hypothetical protein